MEFENFKKDSDKSRFAISIPILYLQNDISDYKLHNLNFTNCEASFL